MRQLKAVVAAALSSAALLAVPAPALADTAFGGDPSQPVSTSVNCGSATCTLYWTGAGGSDIAPIPASGGSGTVTSVTLPAMPNPGLMQAVVLTSSNTAGSEPGHPDYACCQVKELSSTFTVAANTVTTVPLSLHVSATEVVNLSKPGDTAIGDGVGISVLTPNATAPVLLTNSSADSFLDWAPALTATNSEFVGANGGSFGIEMLARYTFAPTPNAGPTPTPGPIPTPGPGAKGGLKLAGKDLRIAANGKTVVLGRASDPPTANTTQTLTVPAAADSRAGAKKPLILGSGRTRVPAGKTVGLKLALNAKGRARLLNKHSLRATLTIVAANTQRETQTVVRTVTIKPAKKKRRSRN